MSRSVEARAKRAALRAAHNARMAERDQERDLERKRQILRHAATAAKPTSAKVAAVVDPE